MLLLLSLINLLFEFLNVQTSLLLFYFRIRLPYFILFFHSIFELDSLSQIFLLLLLFCASKLLLSISSLLEQVNLSLLLKLMNYFLPLFRFIKERNSLNTLFFDSLLLLSFSFELILLHLLFQLFSVRIISFRCFEMRNTIENTLLRFRSQFFHLFQFLIFFMLRNLLLNIGQPFLFEKLFTPYFSFLLLLFLE